jgi:MFS family permease
MATTTTTSPVDSELEPSPATPRRIAAAAAVAVGLGLFFTVAAIDVPHAAGDAELLRWWQEKSNRTAGIVSGMAAVGVALSFPIVAGYLFQLRSAARAPHWSYFARSMVTAVTALWLVTGAVRAAIGRFVDVSNEPLFGPDTLRLATALNYSLLGLSGMAVLSLAILSISVLVLRARVLARWVGYVGLGCGLPMLASVIAQYGAFTTILGVLWAFCLAVALWRGHDDIAWDSPAQ